MPQVLRVQVVILDGVARAQDVGILETGNGTHGLELDIKRQAGGNAVRVQLVGGQAFRLHKNLVRVFIGKAVDLVLDGRAIARAHAFDVTGEHGRAVKTTADDVVGFFGGAGHVAADLLRVLVPAADKGHHRGRIVTPLLLHRGEIHGAGVNTRRCTGFQAAHVERQFPQAPGQGIGRRITGTATGVVLHADVDNSAEEGSGGQHNGLGVEADAGLGHYAYYLVVFHNQVIRGLLEQGQVGLVFQHVANGCLVQNPVSLGAGGAYGRALAAVEYPELDTGLVCSPGHGTAEGVDFLHQVALADATDGRVAGHLPQGLNVVGQQQGLRAHARSRQRSFSAGMATTNDNDIETGRKLHTTPRKSGKKQGGEYNASLGKLQSECANFNQNFGYPKGGRWVTGHDPGPAGPL